MTSKALPASALLAVLLCASVLCAAQPLSEHNELTAATNAAQQRLFDAGCIRTDIKRTGRHLLSVSPAGYSITGIEVTVSCLKWQGPAAIDLTWSHPTKRSDGYPFSPSEVARYEVEHNGAVINVGSGTSSTINEPGPGPHTIRIRTIDTRSLVSAWSPSITLE